MAQESTSDARSNQQSVELVEFSVVLLAQGIDPSIFNPDFLRHNNIVDENLQTQGQAISTPVVSQVTFQEGFTVKADPERVIFEQRGNPLAEKKVRCPEMAERFVKLFPNYLYKAVGINPKAIRNCPYKMPMSINVSDALYEKGAWLSFGNTKPEVQLKTVYRLDKRMIVLDVSKVQRPNNAPYANDGILFQANVHRDLQETVQTMRMRELSDILSSWKMDLADLNALVAKFDFRSFGS